MFTTKNKDNDKWGDNCGEVRKSGWWFNNRGSTNLNGQYTKSSDSTSNAGIIWYHWKNNRQPLKGSEMKMRPAQN